MIALRGVALLLAAQSFLLADSGGTTAPIDLLKLIDLQKDKIHEQWSFDGRALVGPVGKGCRIQIPYSPPAEYDLTIVVTRTEDVGSFNIGLVRGDAQFQMVIDGFPDQAYKYGLHMVDRKHLRSNETTKQGQLLINGRPGTIRCSIRKTGLSVSLDGNQILEWKGDYARLSNESWWKVPDPRALFLGCSQSAVRITRCHLLPITGTGKRMRPE